jgi:hypothetical protein
VCWDFFLIFFQTSSLKASYFQTCIEDDDEDDDEDGNESNNDGDDDGDDPAEFGYLHLSPQDPDVSTPILISVTFCVYHMY